MMEIIGIVIRLIDITAAPDEVEQKLGQSLQYSRRWSDGTQDAVFDPMVGERLDWTEIAQILNDVSPHIHSLIQNGLIAKAELDIGLPFYENYAANSITIPSEICAVAGTSGIDITTTYYATSYDEMSSSSLGPDVSGAEPA